MCVSPTLPREAAAKKLLKRGVKEVVKALKKGEKGLCLIAGDISPVEVIAHVPIMCEEADMPYVYVPSKVRRPFPLPSTNQSPSLLVLCLTSPHRARTSG